MQSVTTRRSVNKEMTVEGRNPALTRLRLLLSLYEDALLEFMNKSGYERLKGCVKGASDGCRMVLRDLLGRDPQESEVAYVLDFDRVRRWVSMSKPIHQEDHDREQ
jgi:hypothetical protein